MKKKILSFAFMFALVALALFFLASTPVHAEDVYVFYIEYDGVTYSAQSTVRTLPPSGIYNALRDGTALGADGETFSIPDLPEKSQYMEFYDSASGTSVSANNTTPGLNISSGNTLKLQFGDIEIDDAGTLITVDCSGLTADSTVEMLKGNIVKKEQYNQYTIALITLAFGDDELNNDMTFADLIARLSAGETLKMTYELPSSDYIILEISWTAMEAEFVYDYGEWNSEFHEWYDGWIVNYPEGSNTITVKNYSTCSVTVGVKFTQAKDLEGLTITGDAKTTGNAQLENATGKSADEISTVAFEMSYAAGGIWEGLSLSPQEATIGTVTITIDSDPYAEGTVGPDAGSTIVEPDAVPAIAVSGDLRLKSAKQDVYCVDIVWGSMEFTYTPEWDPDTHTYMHSESSWSCEDGANEITVTNHSSAGVNVEFEYASYEDAVMGSFEVENGASPTLSAATESDAPSLTATLNISGALQGTVTERKAIGTVTVTITTQ